MSNLGNRARGQGTIDRQNHRAMTATEVLEHKNRRSPVIPEATKALEITAKALKKATKTKKTKKKAKKSK